MIWMANTFCVFPVLGTVLEYEPIISTESKGIFNWFGGLHRLEEISQDKDEKAALYRLSLGFLIG